MYVAALNIVMLPVYVRYMGAEAYGLVGFFTLLQTWFQLLDMGLTPTLSREFSRFRAGVVDIATVSGLVRAMEWFFSGVGLISALVVIFAANWIGQNWLKPQELTHSELVHCIMLMGGMLAPRWLVGLYRSGLSGMERMVVINLTGMLVATLRAVGAWLVLTTWTTRPTGFFVYQFAVAVLELGLMRIVLYRRFPMHGIGVWPDLRALRGILRMAGSMAFLTGLWAAFSQMDKLLLSKLLDLRTYGFFVVATTLAGGISLLAAPIGQALQPRLAVLVAQNNEAGLTALYRASTQAIAAILFAVAGVMTCFASPLLLAWTNNPEVSQNAANVVPLYAIGNAIAALLGLGFLIQFAFGYLRWHVIGNCIFGIVWLPGIYFAACRAGAIGVGWVWLGANLAYLLFWMPIAHRKLLPSLWWRWPLQDVGPVALAVALVAVVFGQLDLTACSRVTVIGTVCGATVVFALAGLLAGSQTRAFLVRLPQQLKLANAGLQSDK